MTLDLHHLITELTQWHTHREPRDYDNDGTRWTADHITHQPPLIEQVLGTVGTRGQGGEIGSTIAVSKPAANLDAIDCGIRIDLAAARWVRDLGEDDPGNTTDCIRRLYALSASTHRCGRAAGRAGNDCCAYHAIEVDVRSWWIQARVLTGWETASVKLDGTCPLCGKHGEVRVRYSSAVGTCTACHEVWGPDTIGLLAEHMRAEEEAERFAPRTAAAVCAPDPDVEVGPRMMLCPDCGSSRCVKVQDQRVGRLVDHRRAM
jgi:hypothetical protein